MKPSQPQPPQTSSAQETKLTQNVEISTLSAFYGGLLTERQREALRLHYDEDWSLAEVADHLGVSRQNIHDLITRSAQKLRQYEQAIGGVAQAKKISHQLHKAEAELIRANPENKEREIQNAECESQKTEFGVRHSKSRIKNAANITSPSAPANESIQSALRIIQQIIVGLNEE